MIAAKKLFIETHGCQMNERDSTDIVELLKHTHQMELTSDPKKADLIVLNTCSIREGPEDNTFSTLGRWKNLKEEKPNLIIAVAGCVASQEGISIRQRAPYVDIIFGPSNIDMLPSLLDRVSTSKKPVIEIGFRGIKKFDNLPEPHAKGPTAFVSIMEGCSKYCSFCIVPYTRGEEVSRPFDDVLAEVVSLAKQKVKEIILLGQNVNDYQGLMHTGEIADLALLLHYISAIEGIERIRFITSHPSAFSQRLIDAYATIPALANHLHLPVQSGSNRILSLMKRGYTHEEYREKITNLRKVRPDISISTDLIVDFPGELEKDLEDTLDLIDYIGFDLSFAFLYSPRPGTPAARLHSSTSLEERKKRLYRVQDHLKKSAQAISQKMLGTIQQVLVTGPSKRNSMELTGKTDNYRTVNFPGKKEYIGKIIRIYITGINTHTLRGEVIS